MMSLMFPLCFILESGLFLLSPGKTRKLAALQKQLGDKQFDIAQALKSRKPLRKTSTAVKAEQMGSITADSGGGDLQQMLRSKLKDRKLSVPQGRE